MHRFQAQLKFGGLDATRSSYRAMTPRASGEGRACFTTKSVRVVTTRYGSSIAFPLYQSFHNPEEVHASTASAALAFRVVCLLILDDRCQFAGRPLHVSIREVPRKDRNSLRNSWPNLFLELEVI